MAKRELIFQGFTSSEHASAVRAMFDVPDIARIILSVAFVNESGVQQIEDELRANAENVIMFAGIRNDFTSYQGLTLLYSIVDGNLYTVDTGSRNILFHPKLYLARGKAEARLIVGSANLTLGGLNNNIEASMVLNFDLIDPEDKATVKSIESRLMSLPDEYPENIVKVSSISELEDMLDSGRIVDETVISAPRPIASTERTGASDTVPLIKLKVKPLRRQLAKAAAASKKAASSKSAIHAKVGVPAPVHGVATVGTEFELVWESKPLERRDLNIPHGTKAHKTGSMNLDKGLLPKEVDHRHYFRDSVFAALTWESLPKGIEEAFARSRLIVKGTNHGEFDLSIRHSRSTTSKSYKQRNAMTRLRWGAMRKYINRPALIGRTLSLYRDKGDPTRFILEID